MKLHWVLNLLPFDTTCEPILAQSTGGGALTNTFEVHTDIVSVEAKAVATVWTFWRELRVSN